MQTLRVTNLRSSPIVFQDPTGETGLSFTVRPNTQFVVSVTRDQVDDLEAQLEAAQTRGDIVWSVDAPRVVTQSGIRKHLTPGVVTPLLSIDLAKTIAPGGATRDNSWGGKLFFVLEGTDGVDVQIRDGDVNVAVAYKPPAAYNTQAVVRDATANTQGNITASFTWTTNGDIATLNVTATSTLILTDCDINYLLLYVSHAIVTYL